MSKEIRYHWMASLEPGPEERIVIAKIYEYNFVKKEPLWFSKLAKLLKNDMHPKKLLKILVWLQDRGYITHEYGETEKGRAGRLIFIDTFETPWKDWARKIYEEVEGLSSEREK